LGLTAFAASDVEFAGFFLERLKVVGVEVGYETTRLSSFLKGVNARVSATVGITRLLIEMKGKKNINYDQKLVRLHLENPLIDSSNYFGFSGTVHENAEDFMLGCLQPVGNVRQQLRLLHDIHNFQSKPNSSFISTFLML
jgi:hypothetical protein